MASFPRNPTGHERKPSAPSSTSSRPRGPPPPQDIKRTSARVGRESAAASISERRTERSTVTTRETVAVRTTRSPLKPATDNRPNVKKSKEMGKPPRPPEPVMAAQRRSEEPACTYNQHALFLSDTLIRVKLRYGSLKPRLFHTVPHR